MRPKSKPEADVFRDHNEPLLKGDFMLRNAPKGWAAQHDNIRRLSKNRRVSGVLVQLRKRGVNSKEIEILIRLIARIPMEWDQQNEPAAKQTRRRSRLSKKLRMLAKEVAADRDLRGLSFEICTTHLNAGLVEPGMLTLAQIIDDAAASLEPYHGPLRKIGSGRSFQPPPLPKARPIHDLQAYALRCTFSLLERHFARAPNKEVETIVSVLLNKPIKSGTVTHLRRAERRHYFRDPE